MPSQIDFLNDDTARRIAELKELYLSDAIPWVVGYSGGKDSTAVLQLVWMALEELSEEERTKPVYVISTDTLVENPIVAYWVIQSQERMKEKAKEKGLPIYPYILTPNISDTFWVNLIGKGYPAPRHKFRWCTERLKIKPANKFVIDVVKQNGEAIMFLGMRKAESSARAHVMKKYEKKKVTSMLNRSSTLPNCYVCPPISEWSNDDVWVFLMQNKNPWGNNNKDLLTMYQGATADGECPLVVDSSTPSCGNSRFGCWVCTLVEEDKSMSAMIKNDEEKNWMLPLLEFRNKIDFRGEEGRARDRQRRDFRRMNGIVQLVGDKTIPGPYTQETRAELLEEVLRIKKHFQENAPEGIKDYEIITQEELNEIRRIWVVDKHEFEDLLPQIYEKVFNEPFEGEDLDENISIGAEDIVELKKVAKSDLEYQLLRELIDIERKYNTMARRSGLFEDIYKAFERSSFKDSDDAREKAKERKDLFDMVKEEDVTAIQNEIRDN